MFYTMKSYLILRYIYSSTISQIRLLSCWSCGKNLENLTKNLFCAHCNALQEPDTKNNFFKIMGVAENYDLDETELTKRHKDLQKFLHPDKFANKQKQEQDISARYSSLVNDAYKTLSQPLSRGIYMLKLRGEEIPENTEINQDLLKKIMEKNEEVEEAETESEIMRLNKENKKMIHDLQKQISAAFFEGDLKKVVRLLSNMKYYDSIDSQIQASIRSKGIIS